MVKYAITSEDAIVLVDPDGPPMPTYDSLAEAKAAVLRLLRSERDALNDRIYDVIHLKRSDIKPSQWSRFS